MTGKGRILAAVGAGMGALTFLLYLALVTTEGDDTLWEVAPWASAMAATNTAAALGAATARARLVLLAGIAFVVIGLPAIFSVGVPLIVAGVLCLLASGWTTTRPTVT